MQEESQTIEEIHPSPSTTKWWVWVILIAALLAVSSAGKEEYNSE
jgi:hypothetical protein